MMLSERDKVLVAAGYLMGLFAGIATDRPKSWYRRRSKSWLQRSNSLTTAEQVILNGGAFNPLDVYKMTIIADKLGVSDPAQFKRCEKIQEALESQEHLV